MKLENETHKSSVIYERGIREESESIFFLQTPIFLPTDNLILEKSDEARSFKTHVFRKTSERGLTSSGDALDIILHRRSRLNRIILIS